MYNFGGLPSLLWQAILNPLMCGFEHVESKYGHVSMVLLGHIVKFGFGYRLGHKIFFRWLPMYWAYRTFKVCVIWAFVVMRSFRNWLESLWLIWSLDVHLFFLYEFGLGYRYVSNKHVVPFKLSLSLVVKGGDIPSSLHTMLEGPIEYVNAR